MPTVVCPRCEGEHDAPFLRCTCGYDTVALTQWNFALVTHLRNRKLALGSIPLGIALLVATFGTPMMTIGIFAAVLGPVIAGMAHSYVMEARSQLREANRSQLREAKKPAPLPQARIV